MAIWIKYLILHHNCVDFGAVLYFFVVKESICESSEKIGPSIFVKMTVYV